MAIETNRFYINRMEIKKVCQKENVDIGVGSRMYAHEKGWTGWQGEMDEWNELQKKYLRQGKLADLFKADTKSAKK